VIIQGDALEVLRGMPSESVDAIVTDPPYGLCEHKRARRSVGGKWEYSGAGFMGLKWDHSVPGETFWAEALRVVKPGANLLSFGGTRTFHRLVCAIEDGGWEIHNAIMWVYGTGYPKGKNSLKPAWEPITVARKPGPAFLNIDACRVAIEDRAEYERNQSGARGHEGTRDVSEEGSTNIRVGGGTGSDLGRWPTNLIHDGSEEVLASFGGADAKPTRPRVEKPARTTDKFKNTFGRFETRDDSITRYGDGGSPARFFYCARASKTDRGEGNTHPTVKPASLMRYLVRLVTPPGGTVLDPFCGSGSTGVAAVREGFGFIGVDLDPRYIGIANDRIAQALPPTFPLFAESAS